MPVAQLPGQPFDAVVEPCFYADRVTGQRRRHHLHESLLQRKCKSGRAAWRDRQTSNLRRVLSLVRMCSGTGMTSAPSKNRVAITMSWNQEPPKSQCQSLGEQHSYLPR
jgi:hypothetical protein